MIQVFGAIVILVLMLASCESGKQDYQGSLINQCQKQYNVYQCEIKAVPVTQSNVGKSDAE